MIGMICFISTPTLVFHFPCYQRFCHGVRLLEKVVLQDNLSTLVVNLYPRGEGYSLMLKGKNGAGKCIHIMVMVMGPIVCTPIKYPTHPACAYSATSAGLDLISVLCRLPLGICQLSQTVCLCSLMRYMQLLVEEGN